MRACPPHLQTSAWLPDVHVASSLLQKALRRADRAQAHRAGQFLLSADPRRLWRRLVAITFEDFGFSSLEVTAEVCALASDFMWRRKHGGDAVVLSYALDRLLDLPRDRIVDCCYMIAIAPGGVGAYRQPNEMGIVSGISATLEQVANIVRSCEQLVPPRQIRSIVARQCEVELMRQVSSGEASTDLADVLRQGYRSSQCLLPVLLPVVSGVASGKLSVETGAPPVADVSGVPSFALDGYTRLGRTALTILARRVPALAKLLQPLHTSAARTKALTALVFAAEGGICTTELSDHPRENLRAASIAAWAGMSLGTAKAAVDAVRNAIPMLNAIRQELATEMIEPRQLELIYGK